MVVDLKTKIWDRVDGDGGHLEHFFLLHQPELSHMGLAHKDFLQEHEVICGREMLHMGFEFTGLPYGC